ncbi:MAG: DNA integrity scanning protein DisA [Candidatus Hydrogenedens sp.]|nr:DNA integrity scanning protein DisA [Candidatus Hydrogenedens sp.]
MAAKTKSTDEAFREALQMIAPGTIIREGISAILQSGTGALICIGPMKKLASLSEGGVQLDERVTPQLLYELAKMDGAIILTPKGDRILYANRFLKPDANIHSEETGTRHRTAQRLANQAKAMVIAVSQRRSAVTVYVHEIRHVMDEIPSLVNKGMQAIQTLEKYMTVLQQAMTELTTREFQDIVTIFDVCRAIQRTEMVVRIAKEIEPIIVELGTEGRLIELQLEELMQPIEQCQLVVKDYYSTKSGVNLDTVMDRIRQISQEDLLNLESISHALGFGSNIRAVDTYLAPRGYRVLAATHRLPNAIIENLVQRFGTLQMIVRAPKDDLVEVDGIGEVLAERVRVSLELLRNQHVQRSRM